MASTWRLLLLQRWACLFAVFVFGSIPKTESVGGNTSLASTLHLHMRYQDVELHHARAYDEERRGLLGGEADMKIYGSVLKRGYYYVPLRLGTPPQDFALIVDTGSTVTYVPCSSCTHCGKHADPRFMPSASSTYRPLLCSDPECESRQCDAAQQCRYQRHYAEMSSTSGVVATDVIDFFASHTLGAPRVMFGCELSETGDLYTQQADGITGLGRGRFSIVTQMANQGVMEDTFSLCYGGMEKGNGMMVFGADQIPPDMRFTPFDPQRERSPYYSLVIEGLNVGGSPLPLAANAFENGYGAVLDSGTTFTYLPPQVWAQFEKQFLTQTKLPRVPGPDPKYPDVCFSGAGENLADVAAHFPTVSFQMGGYQGPAWSLDSAPENFMFKHAEVAGAYCLGIFENQEAGSLIGGISVRNMLVRYDRVNNRFGFAHRDCADLLGQPKPAPVDSTGPMESTSAPIPVPSSPTGTEPETAGTASPVAVSAPPPGAFQPKTPAGESGTPITSLEACDTCPVGGIRVVMEFPVDFATWQQLKPIFVDNISQQLQVATSQVEIVDVRALSDGISVELVIHPSPGLSAFETGGEHRIMGSLENRAVDLPEAFGEYSVTSIQRLPAADGGAPKEPVLQGPGGFSGKVIGVIAGSVVLVGIAGFVGYRAWKRKNVASYVTMDQLDEADNERQGLKESPDDHDIELAES